ncbi:hypothetical protein C7999DRAFT_11386 [Corynascus novoguineensis]|uniref:Uncharacterized protein n=1 Tax=Corynascus novoguineensis TaxID=1126955 RepID=A0AAN7D0L0_9PEZI|nr:hypothetical protein C7999DRAFT_11386 [Corynascus novoguineensis]
MEPPSKRLRFGPAPFEDPNYEDPEADELNERPEDVNARRDPAARLERSRAFAALKLKSAFERIFEKYGHDFTGVSDEIDLRTGEIVVDNGHIQSLKEARLGVTDERDDGGSDGVPEVRTLDEDDRMLGSSRAENQLGRFEKVMMPSNPPGNVAPLPFMQGRLGTSPVSGGPPPPGLSNTMYLGQMPLGGYPTQYGTPTSVPTTDPVWRTPDLPLPLTRHSPTLRDATGSVKKVARLSLSATREQDEREEDDIFLDPSIAEKDKENIGGLTMKQKLLKPRSQQEKIPAKKSLTPSGTRRKDDRRGKVKRTRGRSPKAAKALDEGEGSVGKTLQGAQLAGPKHISGTPLKAQERRPTSQGKQAGSAATSTPTLAHEPSVSRSLEPMRTAKERIPKDSPPRLSEFLPSESSVSTPRQAGPELNRTKSDLYVNFSKNGKKLTPKPRNQILRVEIASRGPSDTGTFKVWAPELNERETVVSQVTAPDATDPKAIPARLRKQNSEFPATSMNSSVRNGNRIQTPASSETFSRNIVDPAYAFSDEEEPASQQKVPQCQPTNEIDNLFYGMLLDISSRVVSSAANPCEDLAADNLAQERADSVGSMAQSPTLSLHLDDIRDQHGSDLLKSPGEERNMAHSQGRGVANHEQVNNTTTPPQTKETTARATGRLAVHGRRSLGPSKTREIPETSPNVQTPLSPKASDRTPEIEDSDPPFPIDESQATSSQLARAPSPTLTDPMSKPQPSPSAGQGLAPAPLVQPPSQNPCTPVKTPVRRPRRISELHRATASSTTSTATKRTTKMASAKKKRGVLSLLPARNNNHNKDEGMDDDEEEDELSLLTPLRPTTATAAIRSTPAGHHVRLGLLAPRSSSAGPGRGTPSSPSGRRRKSSATTSGRGAAAWGNEGPATPSASRLLLLEGSELVQTPGGTMRRCGEGGFRCEREFCFSCL